MSEADAVVRRHRGAPRRERHRRGNTVQVAGGRHPPARSPAMSRIPPLSLPGRRRAGVTSPARLGDARFCGPVGDRSSEVSNPTTQSAATTGPAVRRFASLDQACRARLRTSPAGAAATSPSDRSRGHFALQLAPRLSRQESPPMGQSLLTRVCTARATAETNLKVLPHRRFVFPVLPEDILYNPLRAPGKFEPCTVSNLMKP